MISSPYLVDVASNITVGAQSFFDAVAQGGITQAEAVADLTRTLPQHIAFTYDYEPCESVDVEQFCAYTSQKPLAAAKPETAWAKLQATMPNVFDGQGNNAVLDPTALYDLLDMTYRNPGQVALRPCKPFLGIAIAVADHFGGPSKAPEPARLEAYRITSKLGAPTVPLVGGIAIENAWRSAEGKILSSSEVTKGYVAVAKLLLGGDAPNYTANYQRLHAGKLYARRGVFFQVVPLPFSDPSPVAVEPHYFAAGIDAAIGLGNVLGAAEFQLRGFRRLLAARERAASATPQS